MPGYKGHTVGAIVTNVAYVGAVQVVHPAALTDTAQLLTRWQMLVGLFVIAILFGLWPDIDTNSKGQNIFFGLAFVADIALIVTGRIEAAAFLGLLAMTPIVGKHRGWTHTVLAMILVPSPIIIVPYLYRPEILHVAVLVYGAAVIGYFSHLLLDGKIVRWFHIRGGSYSN
jgi:membrane-bound metal-dependent hydrolase YbcI (DUF457 family)